MFVLQIPNNRLVKTAMLPLPPPPPREWDSHIKQMGMLVVSLRGLNFGCLVSLRVFRAKLQYVEDKMVLFRVVHEEMEKINYILVFLASFRGHRKLGPRPDCSPLGVWFKISNGHPGLIRMRVPPGILRSNVARGVLCIVSALARAQTKSVRNSVIARVLNSRGTFQSNLYSFRQRSGFCS